MKKDLDLQYIVFYRRDFETEKYKKYNQKRLYDSAISFDLKSKAKNFAYEKMPALVIKKINEKTISRRKPEQDYYVAAQFYGKYRSYDYTGDSDPITTYDVLKCKKDSLESIVELFVKENNFEKIFIGIEVEKF